MRTISDEEIFLVSGGRLIDDNSWFLAEDSGGDSGSGADGYTGYGCGGTEAPVVIVRGSEADVYMAQNPRETSIVIDFLRWVTAIIDKPPPPLPEFTMGGPRG